MRTRGDGRVVWWRERRWTDVAVVGDEVEE